MKDKQTKAWDKQRAELIGLIRKGRIKPDPLFIMASDGDLVQILRADLLPYGVDAAEFTLEEI